MAELLRFVQKSKMAAAAILDWYFATLDHPRSLLYGQKPVLKFRVNGFATFGDMAIWIFWKFAYSCPQNFRFRGFDPLNIILLLCWKNWLVHRRAKLRSKFGEDRSINDVIFLMTDAGDRTTDAQSNFRVLSNAAMQCIGQTTITRLLSFFVTV